MKVNKIIKFEDFIDSRILELTGKFDTAYANQDIARLKELICEQENMCKGFSEPLNLMQIYYDIGTGYSELRKLENSELHLEHEIYYLRKCVNLYDESNIFKRFNEEEIRIAKDILIRSYVNLGNAFKTVGRFLIAMDYFYDAINIDETFSMGHVNLSGTLFNFAKIQHNDFYFDYLNHAGYYYYTQSVKYKENIHYPKAIEEVSEHISNFNVAYVNDFLKKEIIPPRFDMESEDEANYRTTVGFYRLFLNPIEDILPNPCFWIDDIQLPLANNNIVPKELIEVFELFTQIKSEYIYGRYLWFEAESYKENLSKLCEKHSDLAYSKSLKGDFSYRDFLAKTAYKTLYSIFDKIGFFINKYWKLNIQDRDINFFKSLTKKCGKDFIFNPDLSNNKALKSLFWIQKDLRIEDRVFSTNPKSTVLSNIRNSMEHRAYRTITEKSDFDYKFTEYAYREELELNTVDILKLLKETIIYLTLAVNEDLQKEK